MLKDKIISIRKVNLASEEKEAMRENLMGYVSAHPVTEEGPGSFEILWNTLLRLMRGDMIIRS